MSAPPSLVEVASLREAVHLLVVTRKEDLLASWDSWGCRTWDLWDRRPSHPAIPVYGYYGSQLAKSLILRLWIAEMQNVQAPGI